MSILQLFITCFNCHHYRCKLLKIIPARKLILYLFLNDFHFDRVVSRFYCKDAKTWKECYGKRDHKWPDILVVVNVGLVLIVAFFVNKYFEMPVISWLSKKLL